MSASKSEVTGCWGVGHGGEELGAQGQCEGSWRQSSSETQLISMRGWGWDSFLLVEPTEARNQAARERGWTVLNSAGVQVRLAWCPGLDVASHSLCDGASCLTSQRLLASLSICKMGSQQYLPRGGAVMWTQVERIFIQ